jgi:putative MFS transporter
MTSQDEYGSISIRQTPANVYKELSEPSQPPNQNSLMVDMDTAIERLGMGRFQREILFAAGLCFAADAMEVLLLSFLSVILQAKWNLSETQMNTIISVVFAGAMVGTLILSPLGDIIGRRPVFTFTAAIISIFGVGTAFCTSYEWLLFARFMVGFGVGGLTVPFDTLAELVPTSKRGTNLLEIEFFWTAGTLLVPIIARITLGDAQNEGSWQLFVFLCAIPCIFSTILGLIFVPESPRWLMTKGKPGEALRILRVAASRNSLDPLIAFPEGTQLVHKDGGAVDSGTIWDLFAPKWLKITILLWGTWAGLAFLYYGVIIAVSIVFTTHLDNDEDQDNNKGLYEFDYNAIFISASSEIFGLVIVLFTIDRFGRIPTQTVSYLVGGIACLALGILASVDSSRWILLIMAFVSRMAMMGASCTTWVSTSEILSTEIRTTGHGTANAVARLGGFVCPYIISDHTGLTFIGIIIFAVSVLTANIAWQLPETTGRAMGEGRALDIHKPEKQNSTTTSVGTPHQML